MLLKIKNNNPVRVKIYSYNVLLKAYEGSKFIRIEPKDLLLFLDKIKYKNIILYKLFFSGHVYFLEAYHFEEAS